MMNRKYYPRNKSKQLKQGEEKMNKRLPILIVLLVLVAFMVACAMQGMKPVSEMTPKEKATWMMGVYNSQYDDYKSQAAISDSLTDEAREAMRKKKEILTQVWPLIKMFNGYVDTGALPDREVEARIIDSLNLLLIE
jgi:nitrogen fixation-related uncharacterized protein